jgi:hypothetical protein
MLAMGRVLPRIAEVLVEASSMRFALARSHATCERSLQRIVDPCYTEVSNGLPRKVYPVLLSHAGKTRTTAVS